MAKKRVPVMDPNFVFFIVASKDIWFAEEEVNLLYFVSQNAEILNKKGYYINRVFFCDDQDFYEYKF